MHPRSPLGGANAYMFYRCFFLFFPAFSVRHTILHKYETTVLGNGRTDFHETFTKQLGENVVLNVVLKWGLGPE